jgi:hypothetical protein
MVDFAGMAARIHKSLKKLGGAARDIARSAGGCNR